MAVLVKVNGNPPGQLIELKAPETVIGRLPDSQLVLDLQGVSRRHAIIRREGQDYYLIDLESRNKTYLNEREIPPKLEHPLRPGDRIMICDVEMVFYHVLPPSVARREEVEVVDGGEESTIHMLDASRSAIQVAAVRPEVKLKAILEITRNLSSTLKLESVAPKILDSLMDIFPQAERGFLVMLREGEVEGRPVIRQAYHKVRPARRGGLRPPLGSPSEDDSRLSISRTIMNCVLQQKKAVLSQDTGNDPNLPTSASIADLRIRSFMCAPLLTPDGQALGILQLDTTDRKQFDQEDLDLLVAVASQASIAVQNAAMHESLLERERLDRDLRLAEQVQRRFLPQGIPQVAGIEFFAHYQAAYEVGGDYYDFVPLSAGRLAIALADVSGKGVAAALMMAKFSGDTRYCVLTENAPGPAADQLNELLIRAGIEEKFITMVLGVLDRSGRNFTFCSAGHLPLLVRRANGRVEAFGDRVSGFPLGIVSGSNYQQETIELHPGDVAVLYSDGVTDGRNREDELYDTPDKPRLVRRLATAAGGPDSVGRAIIQEIREFSAGNVQADDITLVCFGPVAGKSRSSQGLNDGTPSDSRLPLS